MVGTKVLHYQIQKKLGEGGMGIVYLARDTRLERDVAIKFLPRQISANDNELERFKIEARAAAALNHPNITQIYAIEEHDDPQRGQEYFIVMEFVAGKELQQVLTEKKLNIDEVIDFALQIGAGLKAAHEAGVIHRDIKSANIMITADDRVKIMDFSLAKKQGGPQMTVQGTSMGTIAYMSPEQTQGSSVDHRADIWAFGVVLYEMISGGLPFQGGYEQAIIYSILNEPAPPLNELRPDVPDSLVDLVAKCMAKDPEQRFQNMKNVLHHLRSARGLPAGEPVQAQPKVHQTESQDKQAISADSDIKIKTDKKILIGAVTAVIITVTVILWYLSGKTGETPVQAGQTQTEIKETMTVPETVRDLLSLNRTADFLPRLNEYRNAMQISVGKRSDFEPADGCFVFVMDNESVQDAFRYSGNRFTSLITEQEYSSLSESYSGKTQVWIRDLDN